MFKRWWQERLARERMIMSVGAIVLLVLFVYVYVWSPVIEKAASMHQHLLSEQQQLRIMTQAVSKIDQYHKMGYSIAQFNSVSLDAGVNAAIKRFHLSVFKTSQVVHNSDAQSSTPAEQSQQSTNAEHKKVVLSFNRVPFDRLLTMIQNLWLTNGIYVTQLHVIGLPVSGLVQARLTFEKS